VCDFFALLAHPLGLAEVLAGVSGLVPELLLNAQQAVVFAQPLAAARRARFDLAGA